MEKLNVTTPNKAWFEAPYKELPPLVEGSALILSTSVETACYQPAALSGILPPFSVGFIKGWRRSLSALIICEGIRSMGIPLEDLADVFKAW